jgi:hypothetical protein
MFPPRMISPIATQIGPTCGGTKVSAGDTGTMVVAGMVAALALVTGAAITQSPRVTTAAHNFRIIVVSLFTEREGERRGKFRVHR